MDAKDIINKIIELKLIYKCLIFISFWALIGTLIYFFIILPQFNEINKKKAELLKLKTRSSKIIKVQKQLTKFKKDFNKIQMKFKIALKKLPDSKEIPKLLLKISKFGKQNDLDFLLFRPEKEIRKDFYAVIPISLSFTGDYSKAGNFFYLIGNMTRIVKVKNFEIKKSNNSNILNLTTTLETYKFIGKSKKRKNAKKK